MVTVIQSGGPVDDRTMAMLREVETRCGFGITIVQGRNPGGVKDSAGTHDGWGVVDIRLRDFNDSERNRVVLECRTVGFAAWKRTPAQGFSAYHVHAIAIGGAGIASEALAQVRQYLAGSNGLKGHAPDDGPRNFPGGPGTEWEDYLNSRGGITVSAEQNIVRAVSELSKKVDMNTAAVNKNVDTFEGAEAGRYQRYEAIHKEEMAAIKLLSDKLDAVIVQVNKE